MNRSLTLLLAYSIFRASAISAIEKLIAELPSSYDQTVPPTDSSGNYPLSVQIDAEVTGIQSMNIRELSFKYVMTLYLKWQDPSLAYSTKTSKFGAFYQNNYILASTKESSIWTPSIKLLNEIETVTLTNEIYVYPNGKKEQIIEMTCTFDVKNMPKDTTTCPVLLYTEVYDVGVIMLKPYLLLLNSTGNSLMMPKTRLENTFHLTIPPDDHMLFTKYKDENSYSGVEFNFYIERRWDFFLIYYIFPSLLFVFISYTSFFINKEAAPARVAIGIISILIQINLNTSVTGYIPQVPYSVLLSNLLLSSLVFAVIAMAEYSILNYCSTQYSKMRLKINDLIKDIKEQKNKSEEMQVLDQLRQEQKKQLMGESSEEEDEEEEPEEQKEDQEKAPGVLSLLKSQSKITPPPPPPENEKDLDGLLNEVNDKDAKTPSSNTAVKPSTNNGAQMNKVSPMGSAILGGNSGKNQQTANGEKKYVSPYTQSGKQRNSRKKKNPLYKMMKKQIKNDVNNYKMNVLDQVDNMQSLSINLNNKAARGGADSDKFEKGFMQFKNMFSGENKSKADQLDPEVKKNIDTILEIEGSLNFRLCDLISTKADHFSRYFYFAIAMTYFPSYFLTIFDAIAIAIPFYCLSVLAIMIFLWKNLRLRMKKNNFGCCGAVKYYMTCKCIQK